MSGTPKQRIDSIETNVRIKEDETRTAAQLELEKGFREKNSKHENTVTKNFDLPKGEFIIDHYSCAHYGKIPKQGRLFITPRFVLFYANILGKKVKKKIPFENILDIKKDASTLYSVSPIEIHLKYKRFTFVSFMHREKAYANLMLQWKSNKDGKPFDIKIPLDDEEEEGVGDEEGEHASLSSNQAAEPTSGGGVEVQSMWGTTAEKESAIVESDTTKSGYRGTMSKMPKAYESDKKRSCLSCFPCFR